MRFDIRADLQPLLTSYNTKQLFLYLTAEYNDAEGAEHEVVLWDRIITRGDMRDFRAVGNGKLATKQKKHKSRTKSRGNVRVEEARNKYPWKMPSGSFK